MTVLTIIGTIVGIFLVYGFIVEINRYTKKRYKYEFFNWSNYIATVLGYWMIYYGENWYTAAAMSNGDLLNGEILMSIGVLLIYSVAHYNTKRTNIFFSLIVTPIQLILYAGLAIVSFFALLIAMAFFSQTRPVYILNK